jgi:FecR protein
MPGSGKGVMLWRMTLSGMVRPLLVAAAVVVSLAPIQAQDTAAKALVINGNVSVLRDGNPWALFEGNTVQPKQIVKTGADGYARFQVFDGSTFEVFPNSQVVFRANQGSLQDLLDVWIGRVKVYIQHLPGIPNPNNVHSPTAVISVRGTVFEVNVEDADGTTYVGVDEGLVEVRKQGESGVVLLGPTEPIQWIRVFKNQPLAQKMDKSGIARVIERAIQDAARVALQRQVGGGGVGSTPTTSTGAGGAQGDKGKGGTTPTAPAPPSAPPPPPPPGG